MGEEGIIALMIIVFFIVILLLAMSMAGGEEMQRTSYIPSMKSIDAYPPNYIFPNQDVKLKSFSTDSLQLGRSAQESVVLAGR